MGIRAAVERRGSGVAGGARAAAIRHLRSLSCRLRAWLDLRIALHRQGPEVDGPRSRRGTRLHQLPEIPRGAGQSLNGSSDGLWLGPLADWALPARLCLSRL